MESAVGMRESPMRWRDYPRSSAPLPADDETLAKEALRCRYCWNDRRTGHLMAEGAYPIYSFGNPVGKRVIVIGLNPSLGEYTEGHLTRSEGWRRRRKEQLGYFARGRYKAYFRHLEDYFEGVGDLLGERVWEKIGYLDLVKCPISKDGSTRWSMLEEQESEALIGSCEIFLKAQLKIYRPRLVIAHGRDVAKWLERNALPDGVNVYYVPQSLRSERDPAARAAKIKADIAVAVRTALAD